MQRFIAVLMATGLGTGVIAAELFSENDLIGTWKIEPSTFSIREFATPNSFPRPQLPTNYGAFALILNVDKSVVVTNVPEKLFFNWSTMANSTGIWWVRTNWPLYRPTNASDAYFHLGTWFLKPHYYGALGGTVLRSGKSTSSEPAFVAGPYKDTTRTYEWTVLIKKQK